ncbi:MAG: hypothetical protein HUN04_22965 [Desulfobacter sp.]|nr:MAG: hypothetical protein HUN04_22965 [Desulfobacter sp.]
MRPLKVEGFTSKSAAAPSRPSTLPPCHTKHLTDVGDNNLQGFKVTVGGTNHPGIDAGGVPAVTRETAGETALPPGEAISAGEALKLYTMEAAWVLGCGQAY